jgi:hypothetical protein
MLFDDLKLNCFTFHIGAIEGIKGCFGTSGILEGNSCLSSRSILFVPIDFTGVNIAIGAK